MTSGNEAKIGLFFFHPFWRLSMRRSVMGFPCPSSLFLHVSRRTKWQSAKHTGFFKKNSHATWQASNSRSPLQPPLQSCNWKGVNVPNMNGCFFWRPMGTTRKKQLWSWGARGDPTLESTILSDGCFLWRTRYVRYPPSCIRHANTHLNLIIPSCGSFWAGTAWGGLNWNYASTKGCFNPPTPPLSQQSGETEWVKVQQETNADSCNKWRKFTVSNFEHACATNKVLSFSKRSNLFV